MQATKAEKAKTPFSEEFSDVFIINLLDHTAQVSVTAKVKI